MFLSAMSSSRSESVCLSNLSKSFWSTWWSYLVTVYICCDCHTTLFIAAKEFDRSRFFMDFHQNPNKLYYKKIKEGEAETSRGGEKISFSEPVFWIPKLSVKLRNFTSSLNFSTSAQHVMQNKTWRYVIF